MALSELLTKKVTRTYLVGAILLLSILGVVGVVKPEHHVVASNYTYVTVHYDGTEQTLATDAKTVGELLDRAKIPMDSKDVVEPSKDTALISNDYNVNIYRARPVTVVDGENRYSLITAAQSPKQVAEAAGLTIYNEDRLTTSRVDDFVSDGTVGTKVTVDRATPVAFALYGNVALNRTQATTVGEFLHEKHVTLQQGDSISPSEGTAIAPNMTIAITHSGTQLVTVEEDIPYDTQTIRDADREVGYKEVKEKGSNGRKLVTYEVKLENGKEVGRKALNSVTKTEAKKQIEIVGAKASGATGNLADSFAKLRQCEAGGAYNRNSGNGYYGAYQYNIGTWANYGGYSRPDLAPAEVQDAKALATYQARGWSPWPACSAKLGLR